jgi:Uri superfamily endonuclease
MIPDRSGTYALILLAEKPAQLTVGRLGSLQIATGYYAYAGSAFGPGGLRARLSHHNRITDAPHWHMDYLRPQVDIVEIWYTSDEKSREHQWAGHLAAHKRASLPLPGFGASDCACRTHLFHFKSKPSAAHFRKTIRSRHPGHAAIHVQSVQ